MRTIPAKTETIMLFIFAFAFGSAVGWADIFFESKNPMIEIGFIFLFISNIILLFGVMKRCE